MTSLIRALVIAAVACLAACAKTTDAPGGTNTNWLRSCDAADDCSEGASCLCGVCTQTCEDTAECGAIARARCESLSELSCGEGGGAGTSATAACLIACSGDDACGDVEDGRCVSGVCARAAHDAGAPPVSGCGGDGVASGCPCSDPGDQVCLNDGKTYICAAELGAVAWRAMDDGLCSEPDPARCPVEERKSLAACLASAQGCYLQDGGGYCGIGITGLGGEEFALTRAGASVLITDAYTACTRDNECVLVGNDCDGCCGMGSVREDLEDTYTANLQLACADYEGGICDCEPPDVVARCEEGHCAAEPRACYAPDLNDEHAYELGAIGCACPEYANKSICTEHAGLGCEQNGVGFMWAAFEDGPCGDPAPDPTCADGEVRATAIECLDDFGLCWKLESGEYCGVVITIDP